ncbi:MAG: radical SAM protein [Candidatus Pacebacteria bacterium]|nr:radical SAM protein [Candidatus Paceibacterota bacterium]MBP9818480.1 radical SAM protein [Candidatus Paceibacterota bacterium]
MKSHLDTHLPVPQAIISRGHTLCPHCQSRTKALWLKVPENSTTDVFGPSRYLFDGAFTDRQPETIKLKFTCEHCKYQHEGIVFSDSRFFYSSGPGDSKTCGTTCACRSSDNTAVAPLGINALGTNPAFSASFDHFDKLRPCITLIEIVKTCNWSCPTCLAESAHSKVKDSDYIPSVELKIRLEGIIDRRNQDIEILQISGGEPTLHPEFFEVIEWAQAHPRIHVVMINTNGTLLNQKAFADKFNAMVNRTKVHLYLKFNGPTESAQISLAGFNAHSNELRALDFVGTSNISTTLAMTVVPNNLKDVWYVAELGLNVPSVRGVNYQPRFGGGRIEQAMSRLVDAGHVINHLIDQAHPIISDRSIVPLPCGDPNCHQIGMIHRESRTCIGSAISDEKRMQLLSFLADKLNYDSQDLTRCGCEVTDFGQMIGQLESSGTLFRLSIKPFMTFAKGVHNFACMRTDQCCTSVVGKDGKLHSFCKVYNGLDESNALW